MLLPVVAACSGGDESAGATTTSPVDATEPTEPRIVTVTDFCQVDEQLDAVVGDMQPGADYTDDQLRFFAQVKAVAPPEVATQVAQVVDELFLARRLFDPAALQDPDLQAASQAVERYVSANCGTDGADQDGTS